MSSVDSARVRDRLASDRTLLAWLRTGISLAGLGFVVAKFGLFLERLDQLTSHVPSSGSSRAHVSGYLGVALVALAAVIMAIGFLQHRGTLRQEDLPTGTGPAEWPIIVASAGCLITTAVLAGYLISSG